MKRNPVIFDRKFVETHATDALARSDGLKISVEGCKIRIVCDASSTGGNWSLLDHYLPSKIPAPPLHYHTSFEQCIYVVSGMPTITLDGHNHIGRKGDIFLIPRGLIHTLSNKSAYMARILTFISPAGFEEFFVALSRAERANLPGEVLCPQLVEELANRFDEHYVKLSPDTQDSVFR